MENIEGKKELIIKCVDNCCCLSVDKYDDCGDHYITLYKSYGRKSFWFRLKDIWKILTGDQISSFDIVLSEEDFNKIKRFNSEKENL